MKKSLMSSNYPEMCIISSKKLLTMLLTFTVFLVAWPRSEANVLYVNFNGNNTAYNITSSYAALGSNAGLWNNLTVANVQAAGGAILNDSNGVATSVTLSGTNLEDKTQTTANDDFERLGRSSARASNSYNSVTLSLTNLDSFTEGNPFSIILYVGGRGNSQTFLSASDGTTTYYFESEPQTMGSACEIVLNENSDNNVLPFPVADTAIFSNLTGNSITITVANNDAVTNPDSGNGGGFFGLQLETAQHSTWYVDPVYGSMAGDGSQLNPWSTLQEVVANNLIESQRGAATPYDGYGPLVPLNPGAPVQPGDTIRLMSGDHGSVSLLGYFNDSMITIEAGTGETPVLQDFTLNGGRNWTLRGLTISREPYGTVTKGDLATFQPHNNKGPSMDCVIEDCEIYSVNDISAWTLTDWLDYASPGIKLDGERLVARNNIVRNVDTGIKVGGPECLVEYNEIINFSGDGMRGNGDYSVFQYNLVMNNYDVDANHDDAFQSWSDNGGGSGSGVRYGVELRGNVFIETDDPNRPFEGNLQGIGCFDGMYEDWIIENNLIIVDSGTGIRLMGATNCRVANNTVIDLGIRTGKPTIDIGTHKNGTLGTGNIVVNNICRTLRTPSNVGGYQDYNVIVDPANYSLYFMDPANFDFRPLSIDPALGLEQVVDAGTSYGAPDIDLMGNPRPQGIGYEIGAYEN